MIHLTWNGNVTIVRGLSYVPQGLIASNWKNTSKYPKRAKTTTHAHTVVPAHRTTLSTTTSTESSTMWSTNTLIACPIVLPPMSPSVEDVTSADAYCIEDDVTSADAYCTEDDLTLAYADWINDDVPSTEVNCIEV
jgi:hypothetical protein